MSMKKILTFIGFGLALLGGYLWMINQFPLSLILWGVTFLIIIRLNRLNKEKNNYKRKR
jgi:hypothetical protein